MKSNHRQSSSPRGEDETLVHVQSFLFESPRETRIFGDEREKRGRREGFSCGFRWQLRAAAPRPLRSRRSGESMKRSPYPPAAACLSGVTVFRSCEKLTGNGAAQFRPASRSQRGKHGVARTALGHPRDFRVPLRNAALIRSRSIYRGMRRVLKRELNHVTLDHSPLINAEIKYK